MFNGFRILTSCRVCKIERFEPSESCDFGAGGARDGGEMTLFGVGVRFRQHWFRPRSPVTAVTIEVLNIMTATSAPILAGSHLIVEGPA